MSWQNLSLWSGVDLFSISHSEPMMGNETSNFYGCSLVGFALDKRDMNPDLSNALTLRFDKPSSTEFKIDIIELN